MYYYCLSINKLAYEFQAYAKVTWKIKEIKYLVFYTYIFHKMFLGLLMLLFSTV